jgi:hypothetical protein
LVIRFSVLGGGLTLMRLRRVPPLSTDQGRRHLHRMVDAELTKRQ